jgi:tetratricopeptide (TPR) repeat protein
MQKHSHCSASSDPLPPRFLSRLEGFVDLFTRPTWANVLLLLAGVILAPGRRTVTAALRILGRDRDHKFCTFHRILNRAAWSSRATAGRLLLLLVNTFVPPGAPRSLAALAAYQYQKGRRDLAIKSYQESITAFQEVRDRFEEGEATSRLAEIYLRSKDIDQAFKYFDEAVRAYRWAGSPRAFAEALASADVFRQFDQERRQKYFLDIARSRLGRRPDPADQARFLVAQAHYDVSRDPDKAEKEAGEARGIFSSRRDTDGITIADLVVERANDVRSAESVHSFFVWSPWIVLLACIIYCWTEVWELICRAANVVAWPFRAVAGWYRRLDQRLTGRLLPDADEETKRIDQRRARLFRILFLVTIVGAVVLDAVTVTFPNLHYVEQIRQGVLSEAMTLPPDIVDSLQGLLDNDRNYILLAALVQIALFIVAYVVAVVLAISIDTIVFGMLQRPLRRTAPPIDDATRKQAAGELAKRERLSALILVAAFASTFLILRYHVLSINSVTVLLPAALFLGEAGLSVLLYRRLSALPADQRSAAFAFVSRIGFHYVGTLFFGVLGFVWVILLGFNHLSHIAQMRLVLPTFNDVSEQFLPLWKEAVQKYGTVMVTGDIFIAFNNLQQAYDPGTARPKSGPNSWSGCRSFYGFGSFILFGGFWCPSHERALDGGSRGTRYSCWCCTRYSPRRWSSCFISTGKPRGHASGYRDQRRDDVCHGTHCHDGRWRAWASPTAPPTSGASRSTRAAAGCSTDSMTPPSLPRCVWRLLPGNAGPDPLGFPFSDIALKRASSRLVNADRGEFRRDIG